ncbi:hypothetical protein LTR53_019619, partial [Teratosphaeriaceae sp. CCFEE 6253]
AVQLHLGAGRPHEPRAPPPGPLPRDRRRLRDLREIEPPRRALQAAHRPHHPPPLGRGAGRRERDAEMAPGQRAGPVHLRLPGPESRPVEEQVHSRHPRRALPLPAVQQDRPPRGGVLAVLLRRAPRRRGRVPAHRH